MWIDLAVVCCLFGLLAAEVILVLAMMKKVVAEFSAVRLEVIALRSHVSAIRGDGGTSTNQIRGDVAALRTDVNALEEELEDAMGRLYKRAETYLANHNASDQLLVGLRAQVEEVNKRVFQISNQTSDAQDGIELLVERTEKKRGGKRPSNRKAS